MDTDIKISHKITLDTVAFHEMSATKDGTIWKYDAGKVPHGGSPEVGKLFEKVTCKIQKCKENKTLTNLDMILCGSAYGIELYVNGIITNEMLSLIQEKVGGHGRDMTPLIIIPKHDWVLDGEKIHSGIMIVPMVSYNSFVFIDKNNTDM